MFSVFAFCLQCAVILIEYPEMSEVTYNDDGETSYQVIQVRNSKQKANAIAS